MHGAASAQTSRIALASKLALRMFASAEFRVSHFDGIRPFSGYYGGYSAFGTSLRAAKRKEERERKRLQVQWQAAFEAISDAVLIIDGAQRVRGHNQAAATLLGSGGAALVGQRVEDVLTNGAHASDGCPVTRAWSSGLRESGVLEHDARRFEVTTLPQLNPSGGCAGAVCLVAELGPDSGSRSTQDLAEQKFKDVFESANVGKSLTRATGEVEINAAFARMLGYEPSQMRALTWREITHPDDLARCEQVIAPLLSGEQDEARLVKRYLRQDGSTVWTDVSTVIHRDDAGKPEYFITTVVDISAQKESEELHRQAEERFAKAFFASPTGLKITCAATGRIVDVNTAFLQMVGLENNEVLGRTSVELGLWSAAEQAKIDRSQTEPGTQRSCELQMRTKRGDRRDLLVTSQTIMLGDEEHYITTLLDNTERKTAERALAQSERHYRALFENMNAGFALFEVVEDSSGTPFDLIILAANSGWAAATNLVPEEVLGQRLSVALPGIEKDDADWIGKYIQVAQSGIPMQIEMPSDLLGRHYSVSAYQAGVNRCAITFHDVTERATVTAEKEALELQLQQSQKLESIGRLAGGIAHDFNNMLSVILGYGETVLGALPEHSPLRLEVNEIVKAGNRSAQLVNQLLAFSRRQTLQPEVIDLNEALAEIRRMLDRIVGEDIELSIEFEPAAGLVLVDPGQLQQVVVNLVANARDAMPQGGQLLLEVGDAELDADFVATHPVATPGRYTLLAVTDTGTGIPKEHIERLFEPFFTTKERGKGTGLGLATTYGIVKQTGGSIWVYSEVGRGTVFKIYLPVTDAEPKTAPEKREEVATAGSSERILVVEDDIGVRGFICDVLTRIGYRTIAANDVQEALDMTERDSLVPDLLLTDMVMPKLNGIELAERLRRSMPGLKCLFMSGFTDHSIVQDGILSADTPFIQKPFTVTHLAQKIRQVLGRR